MSSFTLSPNDEAQRNTATVITSGGIASYSPLRRDLWYRPHLLHNTRPCGAARKCVNRARAVLFSVADDTAVIVNNYARFPGLIDRLKREHRFALILKLMGTGTLCESTDESERLRYRRARGERYRVRFIELWHRAKGWYPPGGTRTFNHVPAGASRYVRDIREGLPPFPSLKMRINPLS